MYFKPRIFISSTIGDKISLRNKIDKIFTEAGAEVALYEKNLTPSIDTNTYREDILHTDFVLFIIDERYGAKTENGISGTEEEFNIVTYNKKPCHVYLKEIEKTEEAEKFEKFIKSKGISYYFYKTEKELLEKVKSTCFTVSKDICISNLLQQRLNPNLINKLAVQKDYETSISYARIFEKVFEVSINSPFHMETSNLIIESLQPYAEYYLANKNFFIDKVIENLLRDVFVLVNEISKKIIEYSTTSGSFTEIELIDNIKLMIELRTFFSQEKFDIIVNLVKQMQSKYYDYKNYVANLKFEFDLK